MLGLPLLGNLITNAKCFMCYQGTEKPPEGCPSCRSLVTEQPGSFELFEPHLNRYLESRAIPRFDTHHQCIGLVHVVRDITERKQAEEEILRERAFFDQLIETAPEGIAITDTQGRVMRVNAEFVRMFGYGVDEAVGQDIDDLVAPPALDAEARGMTTSSSHGETKFLETVRRRKDAVSYTHLRAHETRHDLVCRLLLEKKKKTTKHTFHKINNTHNYKKKTYTSPKT